MTILRTLAAICIAALMTTTCEARSRVENQTSDANLVRSLPGFTSQFVEANGVRLHFVSGGTGTPVVLLPGWPETWWAYHKIMPRLAQSHRVVAVDLRGMGLSDKPLAGYEKKNMADDISALVTQLGYQDVEVVGHDIGAMVAFSLAANHPAQVRKLVLLDNGHPSAGYNSLSLLPGVGAFGDKLDESHPFFWWFAFHQVKGLPEDLLEGRAGLEQSWFFRYMLRDEGALDAHDRAVYAAAYSSRDSIRAGNGWYQAFPQDIVDDGNYAKLGMPVLGLGGAGYPRLKAAIDARTTGGTTTKIEGAGHFLAEEQPAAVLEQLNRFLD